MKLIKHEFKNSMDHPKGKSVSNEYEKIKDDILGLSIKKQILDKQLKKSRISYFYFLTGIDINTDTYFVESNNGSLLYRIIDVSIQNVHLTGMENIKDLYIYGIRVNKKTLNVLGSIPKGVSEMAYSKKIQVFKSSNIFTMNDLV